MIGPLLAYTITLPLGLLARRPGARSVFLPQAMPENFVKDSATLLLLRPREFLANARDLVTLKQAVAEQAPRYAAIKAPVTVIAGDADKTVSTSIHSRPFAATVPNAKLIVLPRGRAHDPERRARSRACRRSRRWRRGSAQGRQPRAGG